MLKVKTKSNPDLKMFVEKTKFKFGVALIFFNTIFWNISKLSLGIFVLLSVIWKVSVCL